MCVVLLTMASFYIVLFVFLVVLVRLSVPIASDWLERLVPEMTYNVLMGILNPTHSLTHSLTHHSPLLSPHFPSSLPQLSFPTFSSKLAVALPLFKVYTLQTVPLKFSIYASLYKTNFVYSTPAVNLSDCSFRQNTCNIDSCLRLMVWYGMV